MTEFTSIILPLLVSSFVRNLFSLPIDKINNESIQTLVKEELLEIKVSFPMKDVTAEEFGLKLRCSEERTEETVVGSVVKSSTFFMDRVKSGKGNAKKILS